MTDQEETELRAKLALLRLEHGDLDAAIAAVTALGHAESGDTDQLRLTRLKKRKLLIKDQIRQIENILLPDITA